MSQQPETQSCANCRFWISDSDIARNGECKRYPPDDNKGFPTLNRHEWCGEWQPIIVGIGIKPQASKPN